MKSIIIAVTVCLALSGCMTPKTVVVDDSKFIVIVPPKTLMNCPQVGKAPNPETLTNKQIADYISKLRRYSQECKINMDAIERYVAKMQKEFEGKK